MFLCSVVKSRRSAWGPGCWLLWGLSKQPCSAFPPLIKPGTTALLSGISFPPPRGSDHLPPPLASGVQAMFPPWEATPFSWGCFIAAADSQGSGTTTVLKLECSGMFQNARALTAQLWVQQVRWSRRILGTRVKPPFTLRALGAVPPPPPHPKHTQPTSVGTKYSQYSDAHFPVTISILPGLRHLCKC